MHVNDADGMYLPPGSPLVDRACPDPLVMYTTFNSRSRARSKWIALGGANKDAAGNLDPVEFAFGGTDATGLVLDADADGLIDDAAALLGPELVRDRPSLPYIGTSGYHLKADASALLGTTDDMYLRNPCLLEGQVLELRDSTNPADRQRFDVVSASYDAARGVLSLSVDQSGPSLRSFQPAGAVEVQLIPRFYRVYTGAMSDALHPSSTVQILFQGAPASADATPDVDSATSWTADITQLNQSPIGFFRYDVVFEVGAENLGDPTFELPSLDFLRIPFRF
jgi:hypothetical protein